MGNQACSDIAGKRLSQKLSKFELFFDSNETADDELQPWRQRVQMNVVRLHSLSIAGNIPMSHYALSLFDPQTTNTIKKKNISRDKNLFDF